MKKQTVLSGAMVFAMLFGAGIWDVQAANNHDTAVSYDNSQTIDDGDPTWAVTIPTKIVVDETNPESTFTVTAISKAAGQTVEQVLQNKTLTIAITSKNDFKLKYNNADPVEYTLSKTSMSLTGAAPSDSAKITLRGIATVSGDHTDTLNFALTTTTN